MKLLGAAFWTFMKEGYGNLWCVEGDLRKLIKMNSHYVRSA